MLAWLRRTLLVDARLTDEFPDERTVLELEPLRAIWVMVPEFTALRATAVALDAVLEVEAPDAVLDTPPAVLDTEVPATFVLVREAVDITPVRIPATAFGYLFIGVAVYWYPLLL